MLRPCVSGRRFFLLLLSFVATVSFAATVSQYVIVKDPQAVTVAANAYAAMGGVQALLSYQDSQATGTLTVYFAATPTNYPITLKSKGTQETRVEIQKPNGMSIRIVNQGQAAIQKPDGTVLHLLQNNTLAERVSHIPLLSILGEYQNANIGLQYQGVVQVNGQNTDVVAVSLIPNSDPVEGPQFALMTQTLFYVDQATGFVAKIQYANYEEKNPGNSQKVELYLSNYQTVNGLAIPFHQTSYTDGNLTTDLVLASVSFNVGLSDSDFVVPQ